MDLKKEEVPVKIFIRDIYKMEQHEEESNYFCFKNRLIRKVDVMGIVTEVRKIGDNHVYRVDDGTGSILCFFNHMNERNMREFRDLEEMQELVGEFNFNNNCEEGRAMEFLLEEVCNTNRRLFLPRSQGDCVHLQGFIKSFYDKREITAFKLNCVSSSVHEVDRIYELSSLYSKCYSTKD